MKIFQAFRPSPTKRAFFFILTDSVIFVFSLALSCGLYFNFAWANPCREFFWSIAFLFSFVKVIIFSISGIYKFTWRFVGLSEAFGLLKAAILAELIVLGLVILAPILPSPFYFQPLEEIEKMPASVWMIDAFISFSLVSLSRFFKRIMLEIILPSARRKKRKKVLILGAGGTGEMILRDIISNFSNYQPVGFLDDDKDRIGTSIHGVRILADTESAEEIIRKHRIDLVIIAIPSLEYQKLRKIFQITRKFSTVEIKIIPRLYDISRPRIEIKTLKDISIEDLLRRRVVPGDYERVDAFLGNKKILITGAAGSIGSELAMQVCAFHPTQVVFFDMNETGMFYLERNIQKTFPRARTNAVYILGDLRDVSKVDEVCAKFSPDIIFHAAAYKHVPMMEGNPEEAIKVNIFGTYHLAKAAVANHVKKFVFISTDKAIRPANVMGSTKRAGERLCRAFSRLGGTEFISVRFGNVLGSRGSVLPLFLEQLKEGGPLTVTHKDVMRYFMTSPEAVSLLLQASAIGKGGQILALDMGDPLNILELAKDLIRLHGLVPYKDIPIQFTGLRPGEKMTEEILTPEETKIATRHKMIYVVDDMSNDSQDYLTPIEDALLHRHPCRALLENI